MKQKRDLEKKGTNLEPTRETAVKDEKRDSQRVGWTSSGEGRRKRKDSDRVHRGAAARTEKRVNIEGCRASVKGRGGGGGRSRGLVYPGGLQLSRTQHLFLHAGNMHVGRRVRA